MGLIQGGDKGIDATRLIYAGIDKRIKLLRLDEQDISRGATTIIVRGSSEAQFIAEMQSVLALGPDTSSGKYSLLILCESDHR